MQDFRLLKSLLARHSRVGRDFKMANNFTFKPNIVKYPREVGTFHIMDHYFEPF